MLPKGIAQCLTSLLPFLHLSVPFLPSTSTLLLNLVILLLEILAALLVRQQFLHNRLLPIFLLDPRTEKLCGRLHYRAHLQG